MARPEFAIRESTSAEIEQIVSYFHDSGHGFLRGMGVDVAKLPPRRDWIDTIRADMAKPYTDRSGHFVTWLIDGRPVGHSNVAKIRYGRDAYMHLHVWDPGDRRKGSGTAFVTASAIHYCEVFELVELFCEPYAANPAPNRTLERAGFAFVLNYEPPAGFINFPQRLNRWRFTCSPSSPTG